MYKIIHSVTGNYSSPAGKCISDILGNKPLCRTLVMHHTSIRDYICCHLKYEVLKRTILSAFVTLFNNKLWAALFNYSKLHTSVSMVTLSTMFSVVKQCVQLWNPLLHNMASTVTQEWSVLWLPNLALHNPKLICASFTFAPKIWTSSILEWSKLRD
jgi:endoglucanase Acf2